MSDRISRRHVMGLGAAFGAAAILPGAARAQGKQLVAATFPGTWNEAHRQYLAPAFTKRTGASVTQSIVLGNDQLSRLIAAKGGKPPFDVALFDRPQVLDAAKQGLIVEYPAAKSANYKDLLPEFQDKWGPCISMQIIGIGYNPKKIKNPPKSWDALWDPQYKGRVGLTALNSQLGIAFLAEIKDPDHRAGRLDHQHAHLRQHRGARSRAAIHRHASRSGDPGGNAEAAV